MIRSFGKFTRLCIEKLISLKYAAEMYGRLIISEFSLPNSLKTIPSAKIGGYAGGTKYLLSGILYKVATDTERLYGDDEMAMKSCSHDIK